MMTNEEIGLGLTRTLLQSAVDNGAECIGTLCPLCHMNLETYQDSINKKFGTNFKVPILYFTQLLGLAFGFSREALGINDEIIPSKPVTEKYVEARL